jgi:hypothetical protein
MKRWSPSLVCAVMALIVPLSVYAASAVRIHASWPSSDASSSARTVQLDVRNITRGDLRNVDLRLATPSSASLVKGVVQLGTVPAGQARVARAQIVFRSGSTPLVWNVDYDDASGHHTDVLAAIPLGQ